MYEIQQRTPLQEKQQRTQIYINMKCFECDEGVYKNVVRDYETTTKRGNKMIATNIEILTCNLCGNTYLDDNACKQINDARDNVEGGFAEIFKALHLVLENE